MNHQNISHYTKTKYIPIPSSLLELKILIVTPVLYWHKGMEVGGDALMERDSGFNQL